MKNKILIYSLIFIGLVLVLTNSCNKPNDNSIPQVNKYFFRDTLSPIPLEDLGFAALQLGHGFSLIADPFSYDLWIKPTRPILMMEENSACSPNDTSSLFKYDQNWVIIPTAADRIGTGFSVGTNGIVVVEKFAEGYFARLSYTVSISDWVHVALVFRPDSLFLYLNGELLKSMKETCFGYARHPSDYLTGKFRSTDFSGDVDEIRIWDIALSPSDVKIIMDKKLTEQVAGLRYYASFDNGKFERTLGILG
ncbi:MAG: LamG domain-containing protein [Bacteroidales bacterium]|nr:LamG domain-containing protein [Bacteroidales bacterium]